MTSVALAWDSELERNKNDFQSFKLNRYVKEAKLKTISVHQPVSSLSELACDVFEVTFVAFA